MNIRITEHGQYEVQINERGPWWPAVPEDAEQRPVEPDTMRARTWIDAFIDAMTPAERAEYDRVMAERRSPEPVYRFCPECGKPMNPPGRGPDSIDAKLRDIERMLVEVEYCALRGDPESAHREILILFERTLRAIAEEPEAADHLAEAALQAHDRYEQAVRR